MYGVKPQSGTPLLRALLVIVRRGPLPVRVIIVVGDGHLSRVHIDVNELHVQVFL